MGERAQNIVIGGEAGQGLVTVGTLLAKSLVRHCLYIVVQQSYESRIRGGHNTFNIRVSKDNIEAPCESIDFLVPLDQETVKLHRDQLSPAGVVVSEVIPFGELVSPRSINIAALGAVAALLGLEQGIVSKVVGEAFGKKDPKLAEENLKALDAAYDWAGANKVRAASVAAETGNHGRMMLDGNDAIAMGALSAGIKFYSYYPMTPSTSIGLTLAANAKKMGVVCEQAEDEIAAINMAIGASYAGAPSMVATSGGGFALMVEGVSLAAMTETPLVIVVGQRPAPATGLPTRTEQADLEFVLHSGHGEFARAIFAPATVEKCFHCTRRSFELAEKYQGPVFILTDQFLADSYRAVLPFDINSLSPISIGTDVSKIKSPYRRYEITSDGVSPRLIPGLGEHLVVAGSDEHTEDGHLTEDLHIRKLMVEKRLKKLAGLKKEVMSPEFNGDENPDCLFVTWGSSRGAVLEAVAILRQKGNRSGALSFSQVWPIVPEGFVGYLNSAKKVICVEGNATGQFARLIRAECGFDIRRKILRYDGLPITPEYILRNLD